MILKHILVDAKGDFAKMDRKELLARYTSLLVGNLVDNLDLGKEANEFIDKEKTKERLIESLLKQSQEKQEEPQVEKSKEGKDA
jgi:hypothetical protein